jgi:hypothetical protein
MFVGTFFRGSLLAYALSYFDTKFQFFGRLLVRSIITTDANKEPLKKY